MKFNNLRILYISSYSNLAAQRANVTNVLYMCDALGKYCSDVRLITFLPISKFLSAERVINEIDPELNVKIIPIPYVKIRGIYILFDLLSFFVSLFLKFKGYRIYTRNCRLTVLLSFFVKEIYLEIHDLSLVTKRAIRHARSLKLAVISRGLIKDVNKFKDGMDILYLPDAARLTQLISSKIDLRPPSVVYVGSDNRGKGVDDVVTISRLLPSINFYVIGTNRKNTDCDNLFWLGYRNKSDIAQVLRSADVLLAPYQNEVFDNAGNNITRYMSPLKIFEYMASGTPFICSRMEFLTDFLIEDYHCLMARPQDPSAWADKINSLLSNDVLAQKLAGNALASYRQSYTWDQRAKSLMVDMQKCM